MPWFHFQKLSVWDAAYAIAMALAAVIAYAIVTIIPPLVGRPVDPVGVLWTVISAVFVFKDTREHSLAAGVSRLIATCVSFALCLSYLLLFPAGPLGMAAVIAIGTVAMMLLGRRDDIGLTAITTAVVLIVAVGKPEDAWQQPFLRLIDTLIGVVVGIACKWIASFLFYRAAGQEVR